MNFHITLIDWADTTARFASNNLAERFAQLTGKGDFELWRHFGAFWSEVLP